MKSDLIILASTVNNRTIDTSNIVEEYFLGVVELEEFDAAALANKTVDFIR